MGTIFLGQICFFIAYAFLYFGMIHPNKNCACAFSKKRISNENRIKLETAAGFRVILMFQVWFVQIGIYALLTILIIQFQNNVGSSIAIGFSLLSSYIIQLKFSQFIFDFKNGSRVEAIRSLVPFLCTPFNCCKSKRRNNKNEEEKEAPAVANGDLDPDFPTKSQRHAARLFSILFIGLHFTYMNFLFPILSTFSNNAVIAFVSVSSSIFVNYNSFHSILDQALYREPDEIAIQIYLKFLLMISSIICSCLFIFLLIFEHYAWNKGMFYILSSMSDSQLWLAILSCFVTFVGSSVSLFVGIYQLEAKLKEAKKNMSVMEKSPLLATNTYRYIRSLSLAIYWLRETFQFSILIEKEKHKRRMSKIESNTNRDENKTVRKKTGTFNLLWITFGAVTTVVGVCMLMKHDGMDFEQKHVQAWLKEPNFFKVQYPLKNNIISGNTIKNIDFCKSLTRCACKYEASAVAAQPNNTTSSSTAVRITTEWGLLDWGLWLIASFLALCSAVLFYNIDWFLLHCCR